MLAQKLGLFPSAHAIAMGDKEYHGAVNIGATMKARYNAWQHRVSFMSCERGGVPRVSRAIRCFRLCLASVCLAGYLLCIKARQTFMSGGGGRSAVYGVCMRLDLTCDWTQGW